MVEYILILLLLYPASTKIEKEKVPVLAAKCEPGVTKGCGINKCMEVGKGRAATHWGRYPGLEFVIRCTSADGTETKMESTKAGGGHPALSFGEGEE